MTEKTPVKSPNPSRIEVDGKIARVYCTGKRAVGHYEFFTIDAKSKRKYEGLRFRISNSGKNQYSALAGRPRFYPLVSAKTADGRNTTLKAHQIEFGPCKPGFVVDHKNGDSMNNCGRNLRQKKNQWNLQEGRRQACANRALGAAALAV